VFPPPDRTGLKSAAEARAAAHPRPAGGLELWLVRHGATAWARNGRHTGRTDLPLWAEGEEEARALPPDLAGLGFTAVATSPLQRARRSGELAGLGQGSQAWDDLREWRGLWQR
jgi:probable phosphoglycerate mutase